MVAPRGLLILLAVLAAAVVAARIDVAFSQPQSQDVPDEEMRECIRKSLGRQPSGPGDLTPEERRLIKEACPGGEAPSGPGGGADQELRQCVIDTLGRDPRGKTT